MADSTMTNTLRIQQCRRNATEKSRRKRHDTEEALAQLQAEGRLFTRTMVARRANVSMTFLRHHPDLIQNIETILERQPARPTASDTTKDVLIAALRQQFQDALTRLQHLESKKEQ